MSVESIARVLNHSRATGTAKLVLVGIANHDGDGGAWPSIATLARYANASERTVQRAIEELVALRELEVHRNDGGTRETRADRRPNRYVITIPDGVTDVSPRDGDGVTPPTPRGVTPDAHGVTLASPEPSLNHPEPGESDTSTSPASSEPAPLLHPTRCLAHQNDPDPPPCHGCRRQREAHEANAASARARAIERTRQDRTESARARLIAITECPMCDTDGYVGTVLCHHDPNAAATNRAGLELVKAALRNTDRTEAAS